MLFLLITLSLSCKNSDTPKVISNNISAGMAHNLILQQENNENFIILDVRTEAEYNAGHIKGAKNIDYTNNNVGLLELDKSKTYLIYCASGRRSKLAANEMLNSGFKSLFNMSGGINEWRQMFNSLTPSPYNESI